MASCNQHQLDADWLAGINQSASGTIVGQTLLIDGSDATYMRAKSIQFYRPRGRLHQLLVKLTNGLTTIFTMATPMTSRVSEVNYNQRLVQPALSDPLAVAAQFLTTYVLERDPYPKGPPMNSHMLKRKP